jgi:nitroreductase
MKNAADCAVARPNSVCNRPPICGAIQSLHREREFLKRVRIKIENARAAEIRSALGYHAGMKEKERATYVKRAEKLIRCILKGKDVPEEDRAVAARWTAMIFLIEEGLAPFRRHESDLAKQMYDLASQLPIASWIDTVRGCDYVQLAMIIGETGDLANYSNVSKLWKRLGLMPFNGQMPKQWAIKGGLTKEEWTKLGYSPRRRSIMHVCSVSLLMQNDGIFRDRYDQAKATAAVAHPDWKPCHLHAHALLCCVKFFVKHLWCHWNSKPVT